MTKEYLKDAVINNANTFTFDYNNKPCGLDFTVDDFIWDIVIWYDEEEKHFNNYDDAVSYKFYDGYSINDLIDNESIEIEL